MEIPLEDFCHLPEQLGCSLHRTAQRLTLAAEQPGCALHFRLDGLQAVLESVEISNDVEGRFFRDVVGLMLQLYSGDLEAELSWSPRGVIPDWVEVRGGESTHPLLVHIETPSPDELSSEMTSPQVERWLGEARSAWADYQRLKST